MKLKLNIMINKTVLIDADSLIFISCYCKAR